VAFAFGPDGVNGEEQRSETEEHKKPACDQLPSQRISSVGWRARPPILRRGALPRTIRDSTGFRGQIRRSPRGAFGGWSVPCPSAAIGSITFDHVSSVVEDFKATVISPRHVCSLAAVQDQYWERIPRVRSSGGVVMARPPQVRGRLPGLDSTHRRGGPWPRAASKLHRPRWRGFHRVHPAATATGE
jgi:hypothetical protein